MGSPKSPSCRHLPAACLASPLGLTATSCKAQAGQDPDAGNPFPLKGQDRRPARPVPLHTPHLRPRWGPVTTQASDWLQTNQQVKRWGPSQGKPVPADGTDPHSAEQAGWRGGGGCTSGKLSLAPPPTMLQDNTTKLHLPPCMLGLVYLRQERRGGHLAALQQL